MHKRMLLNCVSSAVVLFVVAMSFEKIESATAPRIEKPKMHPSVAKLSRILPIPEKPVYTGTMAEWLAVEKKLKLTFPDDYKSFVQTYGYGYINSHIDVLNPFRPDEPGSTKTEFEYKLKWYQDGMKAIQKIYPDDPDVMAPVWPEPNGILLNGGADHGNNMGWKTTGKPNEWKIMFSAVRSEKFTTYDVGFVDFLYGILTSEITSIDYPFERELTKPYFYGPKRAEDYHGKK